GDMRLRDGLRKNRLGISPRSQKEIDRLPSAVHRPIEIRPAALAPNVGFVHPPGAVAHSQMRTGSLFKLRCVGLDPSEDRRVVDLDSAVEEHEFQIAVGNIRYHRTAQRIASAVNCRPLKQLPRPIPTPARSFPLNHTGSPPAAKFATEPFRRSRAGSPRHFRYGRACRDAPVTAL